MKALASSLIAVALLSFACGVARADNDGFTTPSAAPTQHVASTTLPAPQTNAPMVPHGWAPPSEVPQARYATQDGSASGFEPAPVSQQAATQQQSSTAPQPRYSTQESYAQPIGAPATVTPPPPSQTPPMQQLPQQTTAAPPPIRYASQDPAPLQRPAAPAQSRYSTQSTPPDLIPPGDPNSGYLLGSGDKIRLIVYGEDDLGGAFDVDGSGIVRLPLIGQVQAAGLSVHAFEQQVAARLADGYLLNPRVSVEITSYRPFYIIGEVSKPGEYAFVNGMNAVNAVALAGGYTYRASTDDIYIRRNGSQKEEELPANERTRIYPGDIIRIAERFF